MEPREDDDPYHWDVARVIQELCTTNRSWKAPPAVKLPDPSRLSARLEELAVDGESLLIYEDTAGSLKELLDALDIKKVPHQLSVRRAIQQFKARSAEYQRWKRGLSGEGEDDTDLDEKPQVAQGDSTDALVRGRGATPGLTPASPGVQLSHENAQASCPSPILCHPEPANDEIVDDNGLIEAHTSSPSRQHRSHTPPGDSPDQPPRKKQRIAPTVITIHTSGKGHNPLPTEADIFLEAVPSKIPARFYGTSGASYLGDRGLTTKDMFSPDMSSDEEDFKQFSFVTGSDLPGRRLQVNRAMKRYLLKNTASNMLGTGSDDASDELLPLFGESDDELEYDSETWRAYEEEESKRKEQEALKKSFLSQDEVDDEINKAISSYEEAWNQKKKPRLLLTANKLWNDARREKSRQSRIMAATALCRSLDVRISKMANWIHDGQWPNRASLKKQMESFEISVGQRHAERHRIQILSSSTEPPKPRRLPRPVMRRKSPIHQGNDDEEVLTSDSDDGLEHFVIDDEAEQDSVDLFNTPTDQELLDDLFSVDLQVEGHNLDEEAETRPVADEPMGGEEFSADKADRGYPENDLMDLDQESDAEAATDGDRAPTTVSNAVQSDDLDGLHHIPSMQQKGEISPSPFSEVVDIDGTQIEHNEDPTRSAKRSATSAAAHTSPSCSVSSIPLTLSGTPYTSGVLRDLPDDAPSETEELDDAQSNEDDEEMPISPSKRSRKRREQERKKKRPIVRNTEAADIRETNFQQKALFEGRKRKLREGLADVPKDNSKFIINETKEDDEELVYVHPRTRGVIKEHQVEGVRFMWNQIVAKAKVRQGCLLAHTMGLGKTMQVITLLVAIAEASSSKKEAMYKQIPKELRKSKTLILCPSGLVDNWIDELNIWTPLQGPEGQPLADNELGYLGHVYKLEAAVPKEQRSSCLSAWGGSGGVLVMGYPMFLQLAKHSQPLLEILLETPNIVVADEAHKLKGRHSQIHQFTQNFRARSRIAMTGSPLANNVADYYHMIDWVAPNYLGPYPEFRQVYETPVLVGLYADSTAADKRRAVKTLSVLKETVTPLVHRMGIHSLKADLPQKKEFILYLSLTQLQLAAYSAYLQRIVYNSETRDKMPKGMTAIWTFINDLAVLLAHPSIYKRRLKRQREERRAGLAAAAAGEEVSASLDDDDAEAEGGPVETKSVSVSEDVKSELLATVSARDLENISHSYKVMILNAILDQCKRIGDKVLVFSQHLATLDFLEEMFRRQKRNWSRLDGNTQIAERQNAIKRFNDDDNAEVYLISTKAGGVGLNIHGANRVVIFDFKYVPMEEQQAVGRAFRIGQTKPVFVYWLIVAETFEESVQNRSVFKMQLASRVVDKKNPLSWSKREVDLFPKDGTLPSIPPKAHDVSTYSGKDVVLDTLLDSQETGDSIRRIIMTETFEEEEPDDSILTMDDRKEIIELVAQNHQRAANTHTAAPGYTTQLNQDFSAPHFPHAPGLNQPGPESHPTTPPRPSTIGRPPQLGKRLLKLMVPEIMRVDRTQAVSNTSLAPPNLLRPDEVLPSSRQPPLPMQSAIPTHGLPSPAVVTQPRVSNQALASGHQVPPSLGDSRPPLTEQAGMSAHPSTDSQLANVPHNDNRPDPYIPLLGKKPRSHGKNSHVHGNDLDKAKSPIQGTGTQMMSRGVENHSVPQGKGLSIIIQGKKRRIGELLWDTRQRLDDKLERATQTPEEIVVDIEKVFEKDPSEDIVVLDSLSWLVTIMERSPRLRQALLCDVVSAGQLGALKREDVSNLIKTYEGMDQAVFNRKLSREDKETSVCTRRPNITETD